MPDSSIDSLERLEDLLSEPPGYLVDIVARMRGDIMVLGAGGKMGPSLARMARRASDAAGVSRRVIAVSRFSSESAEKVLNDAGVETVKCDLLDPEQLKQLPDAENVIFMVGMKFGSSSNQSLTWAMNAYLPGLVCSRFPESRIAAFSTGNVYGLTPVQLGGSVEADVLNPVGEYAWSALGRERIFEHFSRTQGNPTSIIRLNYACECRYGVLYDIACRVWAGEPVDLGMGNVNVIWQGDANAMAIAALDCAAVPPFILNVSGPETLSVRRIAEQFGELMEKTVSYVGCESSDALLNNGQLGHRLFGYPRVGIQQMMGWIADWVMRGGESLGKPTHFDSREGKF